MSLCVLAAGKTAVMAVSAFTLAWTHSIERTEWQEDWRVTPAGLELAQARVKGSGAGMEPPDGAVLRDGWWVYAPQALPLPRLHLAASGATASGWSICTQEGCTLVGEEPGAAVVLEPCRDRPTGSGGRRGCARRPGRDRACSGAPADRSAGRTRAPKPRSW